MAVIVLIVIGIVVVMMFRNSSSESKQTKPSFLNRFNPTILKSANKMLDCDNNFNNFTLSDIK